MVPRVGLLVKSTLTYVPEAKSVETTSCVAVRGVYLVGSLHLYRLPVSTLGEVGRAVVVDLARFSAHATISILFVRNGSIQ